jgi:hypothetical protein
MFVFSVASTLRDCRVVKGVLGMWVVVCYTAATCLGSVFIGAL